MKIKRVKLEALAKIQPQYANAYGAYQEETDTIYLDIDLPRRPVPSSRAVLQHERAHALICRAKLGLKSADEERFCELFALATTPAPALSAAELIARDLLWPGLSWSHFSHRNSLLTKIMESCLDNPSPALVSRLLSLVPRK